MRHEGGEATVGRDTSERDETVDELFEETMRRADELKTALAELRAKVLHHA